MRGEKAGGYFYPITAVQRWDSATGKIENGTYFGWIFALGFKGPFEVTGVGVPPWTPSVPTCAYVPLYDHGMCLCKGK